MNESIGFIILRHVENADDNKYWINSYNHIRRYYHDNWIMIVDDNSDYTVLDSEFEKTLYNTEIINSEYPNRGELLPYYYYLHNKLFDIAVIIQDSVFINSLLNFNVERFKMLWDYDHNLDQIEDETNLINQLNNNEYLLKLYENVNVDVNGNGNAMILKGCFGAISIITHDYLSLLNDKYDISKLLPHVTSRYNRISFEHVFACILQADAREDEKESLFGNIRNYCKYRMKYDEIKNYLYLPIINLCVER